MPKILKAEIARPIAEDVLSQLRAGHPEFNDAQIRAVLNTAASLTAPFVKKAIPIQEAPVVEEQPTEAVAAPVVEEQPTEAVAAPVVEEQPTEASFTQ